MGWFQRCTAVDKSATVGWMWEKSCTRAPEIIWPTTWRNDGGQCRNDRGQCRNDTRYAVSISKNLSYRTSEQCWHQISTLNWPGHADVINVWIQRPRSHFTNTVSADWHLLTNCMISRERAVVGDGIKRRIFIASHMDCTKRLLSSRADDIRITMPGIGAEKMELSANIFSLVNSFN
jgi:hypothetical protein